MCMSACMCEMGRMCVVVGGSSQGCLILLAQLQLRRAARGGNHRAIEGRRLGQASAAGKRAQPPTLACTSAGRSTSYSSVQSGSSSGASAAGEEAERGKKCSYRPCSSPQICAGGGEDRRGDRWVGARWVEGGGEEGQGRRGPQAEMRNNPSYCTYLPTPGRAGVQFYRTARHKGAAG